jgi:hypothetical protein
MKNLIILSISLVFAHGVLAQDSFQTPILKIPLQPPVLNKQNAVDMMVIDKLIGYPYNIENGYKFQTNATLIKLKETILEMYQEGNLKDDVRVEYLNSILREELGEWNINSERQRPIVIQELHEQNPEMDDYRLAAALVLLMKSGDYNDVSLLLRLVPLKLLSGDRLGISNMDQPEIDIQQQDKVDREKFMWPAAHAILSYPKKSQPLLQKIVLDDSATEKKRIMAANFLNQIDQKWCQSKAFLAIETTLAEKMRQQMDQSQTAGAPLFIRKPLTPENLERLQKWLKVKEQKRLQHEAQLEDNQSK